jgi:hypothetical protein
VVVAVMTVLEVLQISGAEEAVVPLPVSRQYLEVLAETVLQTSAEPSPAVLVVACAPAVAAQ